MDDAKALDRNQTHKPKQSHAGPTRRGRPAGSATGNIEVVETVPAACPHCHATRRKSLRIVKERAMPGTSPAGHARTHIVWRRCQCDSCHGYFVEMSHENRPGG